MIVDIIGGLGNQLFCYAFARALKERSGAEVRLNVSHYATNDRITEPHRLYAHATQPSIRRLELAHFAPSLPMLWDFEPKAYFKAQDSLYTARKLLAQLLPRKYRKHPFKHRYTDDSPLESLLQSSASLDPRSYFQGYFQNPAYFRSIAPILRTELTLQAPLPPSNIAFLESIRAQKESCFVHIRRGDYLASANSYFLKLGKPYYERAFEILKTRKPQAHLFIFSNDMPWCRQHFTQGQTQGDISSDRISTLGLPFSFVEGNDEGAASFELELMRACKNGVSANSSLSWWAGYLAAREDSLIITPARATSLDNEHSPFIHQAPTLGKGAQWLAIPPL